MTETRTRRMATSKTARMRDLHDCNTVPLNSAGVVLRHPDGTYIRKGPDGYPERGFDLDHASRWPSYDAASQWNALWGSRFTIEPGD